MSKKIISFILCLLMILSVCVIFVGCEQEEETKYDVTFMVVCREASDYVGTPTGPILESWIISPGQGVLLINREYDGKKYTYYVAKYNIPNHPELAEVWFDNTLVDGRAKKTFFEQGSFIRSEEHYDISFRGAIWEKGKYTNQIEIKDLSTFKSRSLLLFITIK